MAFQHVSVCAPAINYKFHPWIGPTDNPSRANAASSEKGCCVTMPTHRLIHRNSYTGVGLGGEVMYNILPSLTHIPWGTCRSTESCIKGETHGIWLLGSWNLWDINCPPTMVGGSVGVVKNVGRCRHGREAGVLFCPVCAALLRLKLVQMVKKILYWKRHVGIGIDRFSIEGVGAGDESFYLLWWEICWLVGGISIEQEHLLGGWQRLMWNENFLLLQEHC